MKPEVSLIFPVYNAEKYLAEALTCAIKQTFRNIEIICVDDGSTDRSPAILEEFAQSDPRFRVLHQKKQTAGVARNNGLAAAQGDYVIFLDADDFFRTDMIEKLYEQAIKSSADIVLCKLVEYHNETKKTSAADYSLRVNLLPGKIFSSTDIPEDIFQITYPGPVNKLLRRAFLSQEHLAFQPLPNTEDVFLTEIALCLAKKITYVDDVFYYYRKDPTVNSLSRQKIKNLFCILDALEAIYDELIQRGLFSTFERSFSAFALSQCVYQTNTMRDKEAKFKLMQGIQKSLFTRMNLLQHPKEFYKNTKDYEFIKGLPFALYWHEKTEKLKKQHFPFEILRQNASKDPLVSVIIPVYNVEKYLEECLESVTKQTLQQIEIIFVNDGSTDSSLEIIERFARQDPRITILTQENFGLSVTRNNGLSLAKGKYIYFLDSDDSIKPDALETLVQKMEEDRLDILYFNTECFTEDTIYEEELRSHVAYFVRKHSYPQVYEGEDLLHLFHTRGEFIVPVWMQLIKRSFLLENNLSFYPGIIHEDELFTFSTILKARRTGCLDAKLYKHKIRRNSIMTVAPSFANTYGYFITFIEMQKLLASLSPSKNNYKSAFKICLGILKQAVSKYNALAKEEQCSVKGLPPSEQSLFKQYVINSHIQIPKLKILSYYYRINRGLTLILNKAKSKF